MGIEDDLSDTRSKLSDLEDLTTALLCVVDETLLAKLFATNAVSTELRTKAINLRSCDKLRYSWSGWERGVTKNVTPGVNRWSSYTEWTKATDGPGVDLIRRLNELGAGLDEP